MHTDYAPDDINEDYIELVCEDLQNKLLNVFLNKGNNIEEFDEANMHINHISMLLDEMIEED